MKVYSLCDGPLKWLATFPLRPLFILAMVAVFLRGIIYCGKKTFVIEAKYQGWLYWLASLPIRLVFLLTVGILILIFGRMEM